MRLYYNFWYLIILVIVNFNCVISNDVNYLLKSFNNDLSGDFFKIAKRNVKNFEYRNYVDSDCLGHINKFLEGIENFNETWALELIDSWGKIPTGLLWGHIKDLGNFEECLNITKTFSDSDKLPVLRGQYCTATLPIKEIISQISLSIALIPNEFNGNQLPQMKPSIGICVPDSCSPQFVDQTIKSTLKDRFNLTITETLVQPKSCTQNKDMKLKGIDYFAICFYSLIGIIILMSTIYDYYIRQHDKTPNLLLIAFSLLTNGKKLFQIQNQNSTNVISCLNGIRCLSIIWIVFGHSYSFFAMSNIINLSTVGNWLSNPYAMMLIFASVSVDSFFFLSGLLLIWVVFKEMDRNNGKLNILLMYFHRYIRLTPVVAAAILFVVSINRFIGSGPNWIANQEILAGMCEDNWWSLLLYVHNYATPNRMCLGHTWYLAVDTQLYFLSPLILIPLWKWGNKVILPIIILGLLSMACTFATIMKNDFVFILVGNQNMNQMRLIYYATHTRMSPWLVGIIFGYFLFHIKDKRINLSKISVLCGWIVSLAVIGSIIYGPKHRIKLNATLPPTIESAFYETFSRVSWSIALAWIVFACHKGYGGIVNTVLSLKMWQPLGRLSYSIYISHVILQFIIVGNSKTDVHFTDFEVILSFWGQFGVTVCVSIIMVLAFESPIIGIEKVIFGKDKKKKKTDLEATT